MEGLIPAHAGKTRCSGRRRRPRPAHPRSRGENSVSPPTRRSQRGSSPLTRGKLTGRNRLDCPERLIPAHAGKTRGPVYRGVGYGAHPRSRGENSAPATLSLFSVGSSPLTRGKLALIPRACIPGGLIPAHAGKTSSPPLPPWSRSAHPRSRGENAGGGGLGSHDLGSSPLTRGKLPPTQTTRYWCGLIPAHAGKTPTRAPAPRP